MRLASKSATKANVPALYGGSVLEHASRIPCLPRLWTVQPGHCTSHHSSPSLSSNTTRACKSTVARALWSDGSTWSFHEADYHRIELMPSPIGPMKLYDDTNGTLNGLLVFKRDVDMVCYDSLNILEVYVAGDTAFNTWSLLTQRVHERPMVHDLMWNLLQRAQGADQSNWSLLKVAIVDLRNNVFIGRLFFGNPDTGEVKWDCDCRPSDGCYLAIKAGCPVYVSRRVWDQAALPLRASSVYKLLTGTVQTQTASFQSTSNNSNTSSTNISGTSTSAAPTFTSSPSSVVEEDKYGEYRTGSPGGTFPPEPTGAPFDANATPESLTIYDITQLRPDDPDAVQLLKRQLSVAISEENYAEAARIRDHEWMNLYKQIHAYRLQGRYADAGRLKRELERQIQDVRDAAAGDVSDVE